MKLSSNKIYQFGFVSVMIGLFFFFNFQFYLFLHPQGIHFIRQTDSLSFASNYFHNGFDFFNPGLFNLMSTDAKGACEFPLIYYIVSLFYSFFGEKDFLLKLIHLLIFSIGIFHIFKLTFLLTKDYFFAFIVPLFLFSSVSLVYYSFNFLPDIAALGLSFSGWYFYFKFKDTEKLRNLKISFWFFALSSLIKITYLINPFSIIGLFLVEFFILKKRDEIFMKFKNKSILYFTLLITSVALWNCFVIYYNSKFNSTYFTTSSMPYWSLDYNARSIVYETILSEWYKKYLAQTSFHLLIFCFVFLLIVIRKINKNMLILFSFLVSGFFAYFLLFFVQLKYHDYYFLIFSPLVIFILIMTVQGIQALKLKFPFLVLIKVLFLIIVISGINYSRIKVAERYNKGYDNYSKIGFVLQKNRKLISDLKIPENSKVIVAPDLSINGGLFFIKRKGWNIRLKEEINHKTISGYKSTGADFLFLIVKDSLLIEIGKKEGKIIAQEGELTIFKL